MLIKDLIEYLQQLGEDKTISILNINDSKIEGISIISSEKLGACETEAIEGRLSNRGKETDYYIE